MPVMEILQWTIKTFDKKAGLASSFGMEDMVLLDMLSRLEGDITVFTLDTGRLPEETYEIMDRARNKYKINIEVFFPEQKATEQLVREKGFYSFRESVDNRKECCFIRKVQPLKRALSGLDAWVTGLRREQSVTRTDLFKVANDPDNPSLVKINPLADWTVKQVEDYIRDNNVPVNALHEKNYPSIGCAPCTRAVAEGEDIRAGRWWWENPEHKECGLHIKR
ncbi:MAG: phosphoadenylyl-sulfate reductase [Candidatus Nitrohelix vancouverensis]|uniref:Adenosine 5'-phosphosulfate reductase n=1 Tax=Candidatus Nitrohelix vancouverensis TaxID=2705534 RepID=A0A7T0C5E4_9BACT|nr:MAG: phosphoadenylyl-sulfate reductase [Candidatus Nitrohelix vancouverensis]